MKKSLRTIIGVGAIIMSLIISIFAAASFDSNEVKATEPEGYLLREYCGKVGVFLPGATEPVHMTDIETKNLPEADRNELIQGIYTNNREELAQLLEDLGS